MTIQSITVSGKRLIGLSGDRYATSSVTLAVLLLFCLLGVIKSTFTQVLAAIGFSGVCLLAMFFVLRTAVRGERGYRPGWIVLSIVFGALVVNGFLFALNDKIWPVQEPPWLLFDVLLACSLVGAPLAIVLLGPHKVHAACRRFFDLLTVSGAVTMVIWATPYGTAVTAMEAAPVALVKMLQFTAFLLLAAVAVTTLTAGSKQTPAWGLSVGLLHIFAVMAILSVAFTMSIGLPIAAFSLPIAYGMVTIIRTAKMRWSQPTAEPVKPQQSFVAAALLFVGTGSLLTNIAQSPRFAVVAVAQIAIMSAVVMVRNIMASQENNQLINVLEQREQQLRYDAYHDGLTHLQNRLSFSEELSRWLRDPRLKPFSVLFIDLDNFKSVNDAHGHAVGDLCLQVVAKRLTTISLDVTEVSRLSGDEFAAIVPGGVDAETFAAKVVQQLRQPISFDDQQVALTASVGITSVGVLEVTSVEEILTKADLAMYVVKHNGRDGFAWHNKQLDLRELDDRVLAPALAAAIENREVETYFQPVIDAKASHLVGFEALSRWRHKGVFIAPDRFIGLAERSGLIRPLTRLVLERACESLVSWRTHNPSLRLEVAVNVSGVNLGDEGFLLDVVDLTAEHALELSQIAIEVTETLPIPDLAVATDLLGDARQRGMTVALDDFGTGTNSISHLLQLPISKVKIDPTMVRGIDVDVERRQVVAGMVELAKHRGLQVIAEGVESETEKQLLKQLGVDYLQGYLFGKPGPHSNWAKLVRTSNHVTSLRADEATITRLP